MTAPTTAPPGAAPTARPGWPPPRWLVVTAVLIVGLVLTDAVSQAVLPFVRRDDWPYLLPAHTPYATDVYAKNLLEGRWLNWLWWMVVGQHGTALTASLTYVTAYAVFVAGLWRVLRPADRALHWAVDAVLGLAVLASALWVRLLYWPGTLTPSVLVAAAGVWTLPWASRRRSRLAVWLLLVTVLSVLSYPPVGVVLFLAAVVQLGARPWKDVLLLCVGYVLAYAVGVAVIYTLNGIAFGHFGLQIAAWRRPNPLEALHDVRVNVFRYLRQMGRLWAELALVGLVGVVAAAVGAFDVRARPLLLRLLVGLGVVVGLAGAQTVVTGITTNIRGELWAWLAVLLPAVLLLRGTGWSPRVGAACLAVLAVLGVVAWRVDIDAHQQTRREFAALVDEATAPRADGRRVPVVLYQAPAERSSGGGPITAGTLRMMVRQAQGGVVPRWCAPAECARIAAAKQPVVDLGTVVGVVVPPTPAWL